MIIKQRVILIDIHSDSVGFFRGIILKPVVAYKFLLNEFFFDGHQRKIVFSESIIIFSYFKIKNLLL